MPNSPINPDNTRTEEMLNAALARQEAAFEKAKAAGENPHLPIDPSMIITLILLIKARAIPYIAQHLPLTECQEFSQMLNILVDFLDPKFRETHSKLYKTMEQAFIADLRDIKNHPSAN
jgi:hypothetical protein